MIPSPLVLVVLALAAYRLWRLAALDSFAPLVWARDRAVGARFDEDDYPAGARRPLLAEWLTCPWCSGLWLSAAWYAGWLLEPRWTIYASAPLAINAGWAAMHSVLPE